MEYLKGTLEHYIKCNSNREKAGFDRWSIGEYGKFLSQVNRRIFSEKHFCRKISVIAHLIGEFMERKYPENNLSILLYDWDYRLSYNLGTGDN